MLYVREDGQIVLNNGALGGLIKIDNLISVINRLVGEVNALREAFNTHTHALPPLVAGMVPVQTPAPPPPGEEPPASPGDVGASSETIDNAPTTVVKGKDREMGDEKGDDLENTTITHGDKIEPPEEE